MEEYGTWQGASPFSHRPFFTPWDAQTPFSKQPNQTPRWRHSVALNTQVTLQCRVAECLWHLRNGFFSTSTIVRVFSQAWGICTTMAAALCMNNFPGMWLCRYLSRWLQFTFQLLQGAFIWCLHSTGNGWLLQGAWAHRNEVDTLSADGLHLQICMARAQHRNIMERGVQACRPFRRENLPWVSFQRGNQHVIFKRSKTDVTFQLKQWRSVRLTQDCWPPSPLRKIR